MSNLFLALAMTVMEIKRKTEHSIFQTNVKIIVD